MLLPSMLPKACGIANFNSNSEAIFSNHSQSVVNADNLDPE